MPLTWTEQYFEHGLSGSSAGAGQTRGWIVPLSTPDMAAADVQAPKFGAPHPDNPINGQLLVVNNVSFLPEGRHTRVRASYVPEEFQDPPPPEDQTAESFFKIDTSFKDVTVNVPLFQSQIKKIPVGTDGITARFSWTQVESVTAYRYTQTVHRITLNATVLGGEGVVTQLNIAKKIHGQTNKLHVIDGVQYLFKADSIRRTTATNYQITYRWIFDTGIPNTLLFDGNSTATLGRIGSYAYPHADASEFPLVSDDPNVDGYIIPPYHRMDTGIAGDGTSDPVVRIRPAFESDPDGWRTLPGIL